MEKQSLIQELRTRVGEDDAKVISDKTFESIATEALPLFAEDDKITDETWKLPIAMLKNYAGQKRFDDKQFTTKFKADFEAQNAKTLEEKIAAAKLAAVEEYKKTQGTPPPPPDDKTGKTDVDIDGKIEAAIAKLTGADGVLGQLSTNFNKFMEAQAAKEKQLTESSIREGVKNYLISLGVDEDDFALDYTLEKLVIGEKPDVEAIKKQAKADYEANYKKIHKGEGAQPPFGGTGGTTGGTDNAFNDYIKEKQAEAAREAAAAEEMKKHFV